MKRDYEERRYQVTVTDYNEQGGYTTTKVIYHNSFFDAAESARLCTYEHNRVEIFDTSSGRIIFDTEDC